MITLVVVLAVSVFALVVALYAAVTKRVVKSISLPTPEEARIKVDSDAITEEIIVKSESAKQDIANADKNVLLESLRDLLRPSRLRKK